MSEEPLDYHLPRSLIEADRLGAGAAPHLQLPGNQ